MPSVYELANQFRAALLQNDEAARARIVAAYGPVSETLANGLAALERLIAAEKAAGREPSGAWLKRQERYKALLQQVQAEVERFGGVAAGTIANAQSRAIGTGAQAAETLTRAQVSTAWNRLPTGAVENIVGYLGDGSPLRDVLKSAGGDAAETVGKTLVKGLALGWHPTKTRRAVLQIAQVPKARAETICRTETLRAYRQASIQSFDANADVVQKWRWVASLGARSCPMCVAMHGTLHDVTEEFGSHPNCRCVPVPVVDITEKFETGPEWFDKQDEAAQWNILGKAATVEYRAGRVSLPDFVKKTESINWGVSRSVASLELAKKQAARGEVDD